MIVRDLAQLVEARGVDRPYVDYIEGTGMADTAALTPGNAGAWMLARDLRRRGPWSP